MTDTALKYHIIERVIQSKDKAVLDEIKSFLDHDESLSETQLPNEVKKALRQAETELDAGNGIAHEVVMKEIRERF